MIRHILFWNYTKEVKENNLEKETLQKLKESVKTLEEIEGLLCVEMEENLASGYDLVFYSEFENLEALKNFQNHPLHEAHKKGLYIFMFGNVGYGKGTLFDLAHANEQNGVLPKTSNVTFEMLRSGK